MDSDSEICSSSCQTTARKRVWRNLHLILVLLQLLCLTIIVTISMRMVSWPTLAKSQQEQNKREFVNTWLDSLNSEDRSHVMEQFGGDVQDVSIIARLNDMFQVHNKQHALLSLHKPDTGTQVQSVMRNKNMLDDQFKQMKKELAADYFHPLENEPHFENERRHLDVVEENDPNKQQVESIYRDSKRLKEELDFRGYDRENDVNKGEKQGEDKIGEEDEDDDEYDEKYETVFHREETNLEAEEDPVHKEAGKYDGSPGHVDQDAFEGHKFEVEDGNYGVVVHKEVPTEVTKPPDLAKLAEDEMKKLQMKPKVFRPEDELEMTKFEIENINLFLDMDISAPFINDFDNKKLLKIITAEVRSKRTFWGTSGLSAHDYLISVNMSACDIAYDVRPVMTMFTTLKAELSRTFIHMNTIRNWAQYGDAVRPILYVMNDTDERLVQLAYLYDWILLPMPKVNEFMTPYLRPMYMTAGECVNSSFYGYANGDIIFDDELVLNMKTILEVFSNRSELFVVGQRTNYNLENKTLFNLQEVRVAKDNGTLFFPYAEDYFFIKENRYPWDSLPNLVIGRPLYDNYLVFQAIQAKIGTVDASMTITALHQTGMDGNYAGQRDKTDKDHNLDILNATNFSVHDSPRGFTSACKFVSSWNNVTRTIDFEDRHLKKPKYVEVVTDIKVLGERITRKGRRLIKKKIIKKIIRKQPVWT